MSNIKESKKYKTIGEVARLLNLVNKKSGMLSTHTIRFWEKEFKQIKPKILNNRRYYSSEMIEIIRLIKFLLKDKGMTINGAKNVLNTKINKLDDYNSYSLKAEYYKKSLKDRSKKVLKKIKDLKKYGKKNTPKS